MVGSPAAMDVDQEETKVSSSKKVKLEPNEVCTTCSVVTRRICIEAEAVANPIYSPHCPERLDGGLMQPLDFEDIMSHRQSAKLSKTDPANDFARVCAASDAIVPPTLFY